MTGIGSGRRWAFRGGLVVVAVLGLLYLLPLWLFGPHDGLDMSWQWALHVAFAERWGFGDEYIWTFGPYGFLWHDVYDARTFPVALALEAWIAAAAGAGVWVVGSRQIQRRGALLLWLAALVVVAQHGPEVHAYLVVVVWWMVQAEPDSRSTRIARALLVPSLAILALGKFVMLVMVAGAIGAVAGGRLLQRRRPPPEVLLVPLATVAAWVLAGQPAAAFPTFLARSWELAAGFAAGFGLAGPSIEIIVWGLVAAPLLAGAARSCGGEERAAGVTALLALGAVTFLAFRNGFTRQDSPHVALAQVYLVGLFILLLPRLRSRPLIGGLCAAVALMTSLSIGIRGGESWPAEVSARLWTLPERGAAAAALVRGRLPRVAAGADEAARSLAAAYPLGPVDGTVDLVGHHQGALLAHGVAYTPRPVMQSYQAYTPALAALNAAHFTGLRAPETVLLDIEPLDGHLPAMTDGRTWLELLRGYRVADVHGPFVTLRRLGAARTLAHEPAGTWELQRGERLVLPEHADDGLLWIEVDVRPTLVGRLQSLLLRPRALELRLELADGTSSAHRLRAGPARAGFAVSPRITSRLGFAALFAEGPRDPLLLPRVVALSVHGGGRSWREPIQVSAVRLRLPPQPGLRLPEGVGLLDTMAWVYDAQGRRPSLVRGPGRGSVLSAHAPTALALPRAALPKDAAALGLRFGLFPGAGEAGSDGVVFELAAADPEGVERVLWSQVVSPDDPGPHAATVHLEVSSGDVLLFRTRPGAHATADWSWWSAPQVVQAWGR